MCWGHTLAQRHTQPPLLVLWTLPLSQSTRRFGEQTIVTRCCKKSLLPISAYPIFKATPSLTYTYSETSVLLYVMSSLLSIKAVLPVEESSNSTYSWTSIQELQLLFARELVKKVHVIHMRICTSYPTFANCALYRSCTSKLKVQLLIYRFWLSNKPNLVNAFTRQFLAGRRSRAGHETNRSAKNYRWVIACFRAPLFIQ